MNTPDADGRTQRPGGGRQSESTWEATSTLSTEPRSPIRSVAEADLPPLPRSARDGPALAGEPQRSIVAVGGGKGGIGKSLISTNLGVHLAQRGKKVILLDADLGGANLHTCLGMAPPKRTLSEFVNHKVPDLREVVTPTSYPNLGLISGALDVLTAANPKYTEKLRLLREISRLDVDCVIIDLGGGTGFNILDFFLIADHGILAVVPEPTSIENAYRFIKAACYRRLKTLEVSWNLKPLVEEAMAEKEGKGLKSPADLLAYIDRKDPEAGARLRAEMERFPLSLVVNQVRTQEEYQLGRSITEACRKYFGIRMQYLGAVPYDDAVWQAVRRRRPVVVDSPQSRASDQLRQIATSLGLDK